MVKVNPKVAIPVTLVSLVAIGGIAYYIDYFSSDPEQSRNDQPSQQQEEEKSEESSGGGGDNDGSGGTSQRNTGLRRKAPPTKSPGKQVNEAGKNEGSKAPENTTKENSETLPNILVEGGGGVLDKKPSPKEATKGKEIIPGLHEISLEPPSPSEAILEEEGNDYMDDELDEKFNDRIRRSLVNPTPEVLKELKEMLQKNAGYPFYPPLPKDASIDDIIANLQNSPWKRLITFQNDEFPDDEFLELIEKIPPNEAENLPLHPSLKLALGDKKSKDNYLGAFRQIKQCEADSTKTPMAAGFHSRHLLPTQAEKRIKALLDKNWSRRFKIALDLLQRDEKQFDETYIGRSLIVHPEYKHFVDLVRRRAPSSQTHLTQAEFDDIYAAFKALQDAKLSQNYYDATSPKSFVLSITEKLYNEDWKLDMSKTWMKHKGHRNDLLKAYKFLAKRFHGAFKNFGDVVPDAKPDLMQRLSVIAKIEVEKFLDFSFVSAWKAVRQKTAEKVQKDAIQKAYDEYLECAEYYGLAPIQTDDPMKLFKSRLFPKKISGDPISTTLPRGIDKSIHYKGLRQCNATVASIIRNAITNPESKYAKELLEMLDVLTRNENSPVTSLPQFYFDNHETIISKLVEEASISLKDIALFFDDQIGSIKSTFVPNAVKGKIFKDPTIIGNLLILQMPHDEIPITILVEDFETGQPVVFSVAAVADFETACVKRNKDEWYFVKGTTVEPRTEEDIRKRVDFVNSLGIKAYYYRMN